MTNYVVINHVAMNMKYTNSINDRFIIVSYVYSCILYLHHIILNIN